MIARVCRACATSAQVDPRPPLQVLVANPLARGVDRAAVGRAAELLGVAGRAIREVGRDGSARRLAAEALRAGATCVISAGGDGTAHAVAQETAGSGAALGVLPLGTSNDLAARAGMPLELQAACTVVRDGAVAAFDVLALDGTRIATVGGFAFPADVARVCNRLRSGGAGFLARALDRGIYSAVAASRILFGRWRAAPLALGINGRDAVVLPVSAVLFGVTSRFGGGMELSPGREIAAGTFTALIVTARTRAQLLRVLLGLKSGRPPGRHARLVRGLCRLDVRSSAPVGVFGDGEWLGARRHATVTIERRTLRVIVPRRPAPAWAERSSGETA